MGLLSLDNWHGVKLWRNKNELSTLDYLGQPIINCLSLHAISYKLNVFHCYFMLRFLEIALNLPNE